MSGSPIVGGPNGQPGNKEKSIIKLSRGIGRVPNVRHKRKFHSQLSLSWRLWKKINNQKPSNFLNYLILPRIR
jgi:hypothetical protein